MKKIIGLSMLAMLSIYSCKKNDVTEQKPQEVISEQAVNALTERELLEKNQKQAETSLALSEPSFDFGTIKKGDVVEHVFEVTNTGKNPLIISNVQPTCGCTVPEFTKSPIAPGQKGAIKLEFNSSNFEGVVHKSAEVYANVAKVPIELTFTANIKP